MSDPAQAKAAGGAVYGRFSRRLRAFVIDWIIIMSMLMAVLFAAIASDSNNVARIAGFTFVAVWLLYEPLLVWLTGSSVGHYVTNLRVVDDRTRGNVGLPKAFARLLIKDVLGLYSFITMVFTSRHQAVHDLLTRSTVQVRDPAKAAAPYYLAERTQQPSASRTRRIAVIFAYLLIAFFVTGAVETVLQMLQVVSRACVESQRCSGDQQLIQASVGLAWIGVSLWLVVQGWRSRLYGCRFKDKQNS